MNVVEQSTNGTVVVTVNPSDISIVWKDIPGFPDYQVNNIATVRRRDGKSIKPYLAKTSVGTYIAAWIFDAHGAPKHKGFHQLVCLAFHGEPPKDGKRYEVNHIDGNKHNNLPSNLEWVTRSQNTQHAIDSGLRKDNVHVIVRDTKTGQSQTYISFSAAERATKIPRNDLKVAAARKGQLIKDRYEVEVVMERSGLINRPHQLSILVRDCVTGDVFTESNATQAQYRTGVHLATILLNCKRYVECGEDLLVAGYQFRFSTSANTPWTDVDVAVAEASRVKYISKTPKQMNRPVVVKDYSSGKEMMFAYCSSAAKQLGLNPADVRKLAYHPSIMLHKGYGVKFADNPTPFPRFHPIRVELSKSGSAVSRIPVVTDIVEGTTKIFRSVGELAKTIPINPDGIWGYSAVKAGKPVLGRYIIKPLDDNAPDEAYSGSLQQ